ncbi:MAG: group 1 glycosyl transferase [Sphingomonas bacterium]|uniref:glycosyltransferase family 4 protein n=1 Tax=Sphingomonas bacterium TaxID=1895847 RepID=UPI00261FCD1D|nr:glycosyltransferase family 4 protein [Sphingomonas bacterium]MDB5711492.1 group 1 glycosyl transferase [Sphingomonas bacterium]
MKDAPADTPWVVCQLGAREHYVLARALHERGRLSALVTDIWSRPGSIAARLPGGIGRRVGERYAEGLDDARVEDITTAALIYEARQRIARAPLMGWPTIMRRNAWFQRRAVARLTQSGVLRAKPVVFAYSYAARDILRVAKEAGCLTVLGQIDPAITEEDIVAAATAAHPELQADWQRAPESYWSAWRQECAVADCIIVNSSWARDGLVAAGVAADKLRVVPLAYDGAARDASRTYPALFDAARPLRLLFLGSLIVRKGIAALIAATRLLRDAPVEFHLVGQTDIAFPDDVVANPRVIRHGPASRGTVNAHYAQADAFILPSLSDGFGLTMLEAMAFGLPVIASRHCGDVVSDGVDGILLDDVSGAGIAAAVTRLLAEPARLPAMSRAARERVAAFRPSTICDELIEAAGER